MEYLDNNGTLWLLLDNTFEEYDHNVKFINKYKGGWVYLNDDGIQVIGFDPPNSPHKIKYVHDANYYIDSDGYYVVNDYQTHISSKIYQLLLVEKCFVYYAKRKGKMNDFIVNKLSLANNHLRKIIASSGDNDDYEIIGCDNYCAYILIAGSVYKMRVGGLVTKCQLLHKDAQVIMTPYFPLIMCDDRYYVYECEITNPDIIIASPNIKSARKC